MTQLTISGLYPKLIRHPNVPHLKKSLHAFDEGALTKEKLEEVFHKNTDQVISEQREAGITLFSDGMILWEDFYSPFTTNWGGVRRGSLKRIFDTNTLQRKPHVVSDIEYHGSFVASGAMYVLRKLAKGELLKATLPGPVSFAEDSEDEYYKDFNELVLKVAYALNQELLALEKAGIPYVEIYDPFLAFNRYDQKLLARAYGELLKGIDSTQVVLGCFYGTPLLENLQAIQSSQIDGLSLDLINNPESADWLSGNPPKIIQVGIFDARTTASDNLDEALKEVQEARALYPKGELWLSLNNSPEFLPRDRAIQKIQRLKKLL